MAIIPQVQVEQSGDRKLFELEVRDGICIVRFVEPMLRDADRLDALRKEFSQLAQEYNKFVFNLAVVEYFSSVALGALVLIHRVVDRIDGQIHLCCVTEPIKELFTISSLDDLFNWFEKEGEAIADLTD